jgi:hypothetical protein
MVFHMLLASKAPEFAITQEEADQLAQAICNYLRHTKVKLDPKTRDFGALILCLAMVEGTRLLALMQRVSAERIMRKAPVGNLAPAEILDNVWKMPASRPAGT